MISLVKGHFCVPDLVNPAQYLAPSTGLYKSLPTALGPTIEVEQDPLQSQGTLTPDDPTSIFDRHLSLWSLGVWRPSRAESALDVLTFVFFKSWVLTLFEEPMARIGESMEV